MKYDTIILELFERIKKLESRVEFLEKEHPDNSKEVCSEKQSKKYRYLSDYLMNSNTSKVELSFSEIEKNTSNTFT